MAPLMQAASVVAGLNVALLVVLLTVWLRNYRTFQTRLVAGLAVFAGAMLAENAVALYYFLTMQSFYAGDPHVQQAVLVLRVLQLLGTAVLTWATVQ